MLTLPIKKQWFDMILSGEKMEEYREMTPYYKSRFTNLGMLDEEGKSTGKTVLIRLRNGYSKKSPSVVVNARLFISTGYQDLGAELGRWYYVLKIVGIEKIMNVYDKE